MFHIFGFYKFKKLKNLKSFKKIFINILKLNSIRGTIIISYEGLNGTISGKSTNVQKVIKNIKSFYNFKNFDSENHSDCEFQPFKKGKIKIKNEVVPIGKQFNSNNSKNCYIEPSKWNNLLKQKDVHILDVRKSFEYHVGTFKGAKNPNLDNFRDFPKYFKKFNKKSKIAMFCTGGVRCEKASNYLKRKGFNNVFQLKGGILNYLKNINQNSSMWKGECYVFDNRVSVKHKLKIGTYSICSGCRKPISLNEKKSEKYFEGVSCPKCHDKLSVSQKERFMMRQKQIINAKKLGRDYFFKKEYQ